MVLLLYLAYLQLPRRVFWFITCFITCVTNIVITIIRLHHENDFFTYSLFLHLKTNNWFLITQKKLSHFLLEHSIYAHIERFFSFLHSHNEFVFWWAFDVSQFASLSFLLIDIVMLSRTFEVWIIQLLLLVNVCKMLSVMFKPDISSILQTDFWLVIEYWSIKMYLKISLPCLSLYFNYAAGIYFSISKRHWKYHLLYLILFYRYYVNQTNSSNFLIK